MKFLQFFRRNPNVIDVTDVREIPAKPYSKSQNVLLISGVVAVLVAGVGYAANEFIVLPYQYRAAVEKALPMLDAQSAAKTITTLEKLPVAERSREFLLIANKLANTSRVPNELRIDAARSAYLLSIHLSNARARLDYGMALAKGQLGLPEPDGAKEQYAKALKAVQGKAQQGDPTSSYTYAMMLAGGMGIEQNKAAAISLVKSVWKELPLDDVSRISLDAALGMDMFDEPEPDFAIETVKYTIDKGVFDSWVLERACRAEWRLAIKKTEDERDRVFLQFLAKEIPREMAATHLRRADVEFNTAKKNLLACEVEPIREIAAKGNLEAQERLAELIGKIKPTSTAPAADSKWWKNAPLANSNTKPARTAPVADPESQKATGYLEGTKQSSKDGRSTFKVDNTKGGGDAIVRLYRDGKKPASRSMFVKNGESFTAEAIAAGNYKLRYRFAGSEDTFEANESFQLIEIHESDGIKFSKVTVTLFKVANGNLSMKKVDASDF